MDGWTYMAVDRTGLHGLRMAARLHGCTRLSRAAGKHWLMAADGPQLRGARERCWNAASIPDAIGASYPTPWPALCPDASHPSRPSSAAHPARPLPTSFKSALPPFTQSPLLPLPSPPLHHCTSACPPAATTARQVQLLYLPLQHCHHHHHHHQCSALTSPVAAPSHLQLA